MKRIVWQAPDGSIRITCPVDPAREGETEQQYLDRIAARAQQADPSLADCVRLADVDSAALPARRWRQAWRVVAGVLGVPLIRARAIRRQELEARRERLLVRLRELIEDAEDRNQAVRLAALKTKRRQVRLVDLDTALAAVADLATLDTFEPSDFEGVE